MNRALQGKEILNANPEPSIRKPKKVRFKDQYPAVDLAVISAAGFLRNSKRKDAHAFIATLSEIEKIIEEKRDPEQQLDL
jgi:hypothetical protein